MRYRLSINLVLAVSLAVLGAAIGAACSNASASASPEQPIAFPHLVHTQNEVPCSFCHSYVEQYDSAGIPRADLCATCHSAMPQDDPRIQRLFEYVNEGEQIPWVRLYEVPQYVHFSHKWHVRAGVECSTCHGDIGESEIAVRHMTYEMDWCVTCHEEQDAPIDCVTCHQ